MDSSQVDTLVRRLVVNPHDEQALATAHQAGASDPKSYALLLERVGTETPDSGYASHWLAEAANVWSTTLGDAHRAARVLMQAIDRDPTQRTAAARLADLYRDKGDVKALVALLERRAKALAPIVTQSPEVRAELTAMHEELGRLWNESLGQPKKALDHFRRAMDLDPSSAFAIYSAREIYKALGQFDDVWGMYDAELNVERDPARKLALLRDEAAVRRQAGDPAGATRALARARQLDPHDPALQQEYGALIVERLGTGETVPQQERTLAAELLVGLAEIYDGEHGLAYSSGALDIEPGHDRALQLYAYYARALQREDDVASRYLAYLYASPHGTMAADARWLLAASYEAAGQLHEAVQILEPIRGSGDPHATAKLQQLYAQLGVRMPSAPPPPAPFGQRPQVRPADDAHEAPLSASQDPEPLPATPLEAAQALSVAGRRDEAYAEYRRVLEGDPAQPEALSWAEDYLRARRDYRALRDLLVAAVRAPGATVESRRDRLREIAGLSEGNLRDEAGAIDAWKQLLSLDRGDESARQSLTRALEKMQRWDDLALLFESEASGETDVEKKIALERRIATLHEQRRHDFVAAAEAWERIAILIPDDDQALSAAASLFERAGALDRAAQVIAAGASSIDDVGARDALYEHLGELRERLGDVSGAGDAYAKAASSQASARLWEAAERCFVAAQNWTAASGAAATLAGLEADPVEGARHHARAADHNGRAGNEAGFVEQLTKATDLDPTSDDFARLLVEHYTTTARFEDLVAFWLRRANGLEDRARRVRARKEAARIYAEHLHNPEAARATWQHVLQDSEDREALEQLVAGAIALEDYVDATTLSRRLEAIAPEPVEKTRIALREAELVADGLGDIETAVQRYERILAELDPTCRPALQAIADLQEARENPAAAAGALERELRLVENPEGRAPIAERLSRLYEQLDRPEDAIRALDVVRLGDPEDFDALARLCDLCEKTKNWDKLAEHLAERIEIEADEDEVRALTEKLAAVLSDKLQRGDQALAVLDELASQGDERVQEAYVALGDSLGWHGLVASKLVVWWFNAKPGPARIANLRGAFERYSAVGRDDDAVRVGHEIARSKGADGDLARKLEELGVKTNNLEAVSAAHDLIASDLSGEARAEELVRQAEIQLRVGAARADALHHGEAGLTSVAPDHAEPLLARLATIAQEPTEIVALYERQIGRCKLPGDRVAALARAAQVAAANQALDRAAALFDLALGSTLTEESLNLFEHAARDADALAGGEALRRTLATSMANGGQGARDGGRTRGALLRRAASIARTELNDIDQAFTWVGDALVAHVEPATLDALEELAESVADYRRAESTLTRALAEVFDGPLVRQLLARRAKLRRDRLDDVTGAAADLKKIYDLQPSDAGVLGDLSALLVSLGDHRAMVQLYEDQILRGKDLSVRAELARKVARLWEQELADSREAADAWRRVLRMKPGDAEATTGLEQAKVNMLKRAPAAPELPSKAHVEAPAEGTAHGEAPAEGAGHGEAPAEGTAHGEAPAEGTAHVEAPPQGIAPVEGESQSVDASSAASPPPLPQSTLAAVPAADEDAHEPGGDNEVLIADDLAEMIEAEPDQDEESVPDAHDLVKRSIPPPLPRP